MSQGHLLKRVVATRIYHLLNKDLCKNPFSPDSRLPRPRLCLSAHKPRVNRSEERKNRNYSRTVHVEQVLERELQRSFSTEDHWRRERTQAKQASAKLQPYEYQHYPSEAVLKLLYFKDRKNELGRKRLPRRKEG